MSVLLIAHNKKPSCVFPKQKIMTEREGSEGYAEVLDKMDTHPCLLRTVNWRWPWRTQGLWAEPMGWARENGCPLRRQTGRQDKHQARIGRANQGIACYTAWQAERQVYKRAKRKSIRVKDLDGRAISAMRYSIYRHLGTTLCLKYSATGLSYTRVIMCEYFCVNPFAVTLRDGIHIWQLTQKNLGNVAGSLRVRYKVTHVDFEFYFPIRPKSVKSSKGYFKTTLSWNYSA